MLFLYEDLICTDTFVQVKVTQVCRIGILLTLHHVWTQDVCSCLNYQSQFYCISDKCMNLPFFLCFDWWTARFAVASFLIWNVLVDSYFDELTDLDLRAAKNHRQVGKRCEFLEIEISFTFTVIYSSLIISNLFLCQTVYLTLVFNFSMANFARPRVWSRDFLGLVTWP